MLELIVTGVFAVIIAAGAVQLIRARSRISAWRAELHGASHGEGHGERTRTATEFERRTAVAQWERQRDLLVAAVLLLLAGAALTSLGDPLRAALPWWTRLTGVAIFLAIGVVGITAVILRSTARARRLALLCPRCHAPLTSGADRTREFLRTGRCRECRLEVFHPVGP